MKQDNIVAFMAKNNKKFRESDYGTVRNTLANVDDCYFPLLMGKSFTMGWMIILSVLIWMCGIVLAIEGGILIDESHWSYDPGDIILGIFFCVLAPLAIALGIYLLLMIRKKAALKNLQKIATNLQQNEVTD